MDFQNSEPGIDGRGASFDHAAEGGAAAAATGLPRGVTELLAEPIVRSLMAADRVDPKAVEELLRRIAAQLARGRAGGALHDLFGAAS